MKTKEVIREVLVTYNELGQVVSYRNLFDDINPTDITTCYEIGYTWGLGVRDDLKDLLIDPREAYYRLRSDNGMLNKKE